MKGARSGGRLIRMDSGPFVGALFPGVSLIAHAEIPGSIVLSDQERDDRIEERPSPELYEG